MPFVEIIRAAEKDGYDLVLAETRGLSPYKRFLVGSTAERLVRKCPCPVWIVKAAHQAPIGSVLVATDLSEVSAKAVKIGVLLSTTAGIPLDVLHVYEDGTGLDNLLDRDTSIAFRRTHRRRLRRSADERLREFIQSCVPEASKPRLRLAHGEPSRIIASVVRRSHADLLVMGSVARTGIPGFFIGNTAEKVLRTCDCSILTVKPDGFVSPIQPLPWISRPELTGVTPISQKFSQS